MDQKAIKNHAEIKTLIRSVVSYEKIEEKRLNFLFEKSVNIFHPFDYDFWKLLNTYYMYFIKDKNLTKNNFKRCFDVVELILKNLYHNFPEMDIKIFDLEIAATGLCNNLKSFDEAKSHLKKAEKISKFYCEDPKYSRMVQIHRNRLDFNMNLCRQPGNIEDFYKFWNFEK